MQVNEFKDIVGAFWKRVRQQGYAAHGVIQDKNTVLVNGKTMTYEVAVPINCTPGKRVFVHVEGNKAVVIGA
jgi:hypothetical protein